MPCLISGFAHRRRGEPLAQSLPEEAMNRMEVGAIAEAELPSCPASGSCGSREMLVATRRASSQPSCVIRCPPPVCNAPRMPNGHLSRQTLPIQRTDYETMASSWRHLARSYEFVESLERFLLDALKAKMPPPRATAE
jgi:hypothetical protein